MQQRGKNKGALPPDLEADPRHGEVVKRLPLYFTPHLAKRQKNARKIDTCNTLWHGKHHALPRIPMLGGDDTRPASDKDNWEDPPTVLWKTTRRRMEWHPENVDEKKPPLGGRGEFVPCGYDQNRWQGLATSTETERSNYKGNLTDVKYKSSVVTTDGLKYRGAVYVRDGKVHVSLMDEMYKMTPWNAHASALGSAANERTGVSQEEEATNAASARNKAIKVHVKRTETDQQEEARKRSYAYYKEVDDSDEWKYVANRCVLLFAYCRLRVVGCRWCEARRVVLPYYYHSLVRRFGRSFSISISCRSHYRFKHVRYVSDDGAQPHAQPSRCTPLSRRTPAGRTSRRHLSTRPRTRKSSSRRLPPWCA